MSTDQENPKDETKEKYIQGLMDDLHVQIKKGQTENSLVIYAELKSAMGLQAEYPGDGDTNEFLRRFRYLCRKHGAKACVTAMAENGKRLVAGDTELSNLITDALNFLTLKDRIIADFDLMGKVAKNLGLVESKDGIVTDLCAIVTRRMWYRRLIPRILRKSEKKVK